MLPFFREVLEGEEGVTIVCEGLIYNFSVEIEFPHQILRGPHHFTPIAR